MRRMVIALALLAATGTAFAQTAPPFAPIADRDLWDALGQALDDIPMSVRAHQQAREILQSVEREAATRDARAKARTTVQPAPAPPQ